MSAGAGIAIAGVALALAGFAAICVVQAPGTAPFALAVVGLALVFVMTAT